MSSPAPAKRSLVQLGYRRAAKRVPSRFNARALGEDGRLVLWNTFTGAVSAFRAEDRDAVAALLSPEGTTDVSGRLAEHLDRRGFLVPDDVDELNRFRYAYARGQWRSDTLELTLLASEDCNFRCVYCYEKFEHATMRPEVREGIKRFVARRAPQLSHLRVAWFGGEPLYGWEAVADLAPFFRDLTGQHGIAYAQDMTTNGYLLDDRRADALLAWGCRSFQVTLDGIAADHDCRRVGRDGTPTYEVILRNLLSLQRRQEPFLVVIRVNFDRENAPRLDALLEELSRAFRSDPRFLLRFRPVGKWGGARDAELHTCGLDEGRRITHDLQAAALDAGLRVEGGVQDHAAMGSQVCYAARPYHFVVGATGTLMKCTVALDGLEDNIVGRVHADGEWEILDERMLRWVNPFFESDATCRRCHLLPSCQGAACPLHRIQTGERSCCGSRSNLKHELRLALRQPRAAIPSPQGG